MAATHRNQRIDNLEASLQRHADRRAIHDGRGRSFDRQASARYKRPLVIQWSSEWIDDAPKQPFTDRHIHDPPGALNAITGTQVRVVAEQNHTNIVFIQIESDTEYIARESKQLVGANMR